MNQNAIRRRDQRGGNQNHVVAPRGRTPRRPAANNRALRYIVLALVLFIVTILIVGYLKKDDRLDLKIENYEHLKKAENITTAARLLKKCVQIFDGLDRLQNATNTYQIDGVLAKFLKGKYQYAVSTISSLTALLKKYEDMKRTTKPEQFVKASHKQLDDVMKYLVDELQGDEFVAVVKRDAEMAIDILQSVKAAFSTFNFVQKAASDPLIVKEEIYLVPIAAMRKGDQELLSIKEEIMRKYDLLTALDTVKGMIDILEKRDMWVEELVQVDLKYGIRAHRDDISELSMSNEDILWLKQIHDNLDVLEEQKEEYLRKHGLPMQSLLPHHSRIWTSLQHTRAEAQMQADLKNNFIRMRKEIQGNVDELRKRLEKL